MTSTPRRRAHSLLAVVVPALVAGLLIVAASFVPAQQPTARVVDAGPTVQTRACAFTGAPGALVASGAEVETTLLDGQVIDDPSVNGAVTGSVVLRAAGEQPLTAGVRSQSSAGLMWAECRPPATTGSLLLPDPATAEVVLVNPDRTDAGVNITLSGATGQIQSPGLRGIVVPAGSMVRVPISVHAPAGAPVTATYQASQGRVQAAVRSLTTAPEQAVATAPKRVAVFAAVPTRPTGARLLLHNPGGERAEVTIELLGPRGRFAPANGTASLAPHTTVAIDLGAAFTERDMGLVVTGSSEVLSMLTTQGANDIAWMLPDEAATDLMDAVPEGTLQVVNPSPDEASVTMVQVHPDGTADAPQTLTIPAGASGQFPVVAGQVRITSTAPIAAAVRVAGTGQAVSRVRPPAGVVVPQPGTMDPQLAQ
ncbi:DUF5719 family protein [Aestuariimicrobium sp. Y1814]|uniref:DUF5719 family protein n=1 Tax=Aestuariimicrobium sp. Y1814 TaxID=3418742 RepID=UPI003DA6D513